MTDIDLGFAETRESAWLVNRYFPSKLGGLPSWLNLETLPTKKELECGNCKGPMSFLCQIYASGEEEHAFHRTVYVFICRLASCQRPNSAKNFAVFRSQLPLLNSFYSREPPIEDGTPLPEHPTIQKLCLACGCVAPSACARCKTANYCSIQHQRAHWKYHKLDCGKDKNTTAESNNIPQSLPDIMFPEWEIVVETNDREQKNEPSGMDEEKMEKQRILEFEKLLAEGKTGDLKDVTEEELDKYVTSSNEIDDKIFRKFKKEVNKDPEQILRYKRSGEPLWITDVKNTIESQLLIPNCELCGSPRTYEFQVMPQMLMLLQDERLDWGVLAVYTCSKNCKVPFEVGYLREYIVKQDILDNK